MGPEGMRFVDEFRDREKAQGVAAKIAKLVEPGRRYGLMEICGGHTHTIYKHGIEDYLPEEVQLVHGPGCPVCVIPMGRVDDAIWIAEQEGVIMTRSATCSASRPAAPSSTPRPAAPTSRWCTRRSTR